MSMLLMVAAMKAKLGNPIRKLVLIKLADNANDDGICWPSYRHIADQCEVDRKTAIRHVEWLEENKFLSKQYRKDDERGNKSNVYRIDIAGGIAHLVAQNTQPGGIESPPPSGTESPRTSHSFEPINEPVISGTSADAPCSVCGGLKIVTSLTGGHARHEGCNHCSGTGKEPVIRNSRTTELTGTAGELSGADKPENPDAGISGRSSAAGDTNKPTKPKKPTKAQALFNLVRENPTQWPALNCVDDTLLTEWAKLRTRKGASSEQRALNTIEKTLEELRTVHGIAPDAALAAQCDAGWATVKVEYLVKNRPNMSYTGNQQPAQNQRREIHVARQASELSEDQMAELKAQREALKNMTKDL